MSITNFPFGVSSFGIPLLGGDKTFTTGKVFFVHSSTGRDSRDRGASPAAPFRTLAYALTRVRADTHDLIIVMPGHTETVSTAAGLNFNRAHVGVVGVGVGRLRPVFTLNTTVATIALAAQGCGFENVVIDLTGVDNIANGIVVTAADCYLRNVEIIQGNATNQAVKAISFNSNAHRLHLFNCTIYSTAAGASHAIGVDGAAERVVIDLCTIDGFYSNSCIGGTANAISLRIVRCSLSNRTANLPVINVTASTTGECAFNVYRVNAVTGIAGVLTAAGMYHFENYAMEAAGSSGILVPAAGTIT